MTDYMKEAERMLDESSDAVSDVVGFAQDPAGYSRRVKATRAALLAHIQRGVPEGNERDEWEAVVFTLMGHAASLYFLGQSDMPNWFYELAEKLARRHVDEALAARVREVGIQQRAALAAAPDQFRDATKMTPAPAEVPMPEADITGIDRLANAYADAMPGMDMAAARTLAWISDKRERESQIHDDAERYRFITDDHADSDVRRAVSAVCDAIVIRGKGATDAAIDALRGEVKCGLCDGTGRMVRDADIGTDQECFVCGGSGEVKP